MNISKYLFCALFSLSCLVSVAHAEEKKFDFGHWIWDEQLKPTLVKTYDKTSLTIAATGIASSLIVHEYDKKISRFSENGGNYLIGHKMAEDFGQLGNGVFGIAVVGTQLYFDNKNGQKTARAFILTTVSHVGLSALVRRDRPNNRTDFLPWPSSFPSGHTASAFSVAGGLAYSYGWKAGVPAYAVASMIGLGRLKENRHWASDILAGAFLGTFWARASFAAEEVDREAFLFIPMPVNGGAMLSAMREF